MDDRPPLVIRDGRQPTSPYTAEETRRWYAENLPNTKLIDLDQIMAERKVRERQRLDAIFGPGVDPPRANRDRERMDAGTRVIPFEANRDRERMDAGTRVIPFEANSDATDRESMDTGTRVVPFEGTATVGSSSEETVVTDSSLAQNEEEGPVPKRPRKDLGPSNEENATLSSDDDDAGAKPETEP